MSNLTPPPVIVRGPTPPKAFGPPEIGALVSVVVVIVAAIVVAPKDTGAYAAGELVGRLIGAMVLSAIIATVVWLFTRRSAPKAAIWTFAGVMLLCSGVTLMSSKAVSDARTREALDGFQQEMKSVRQGAPPGEGTPMDMDRVDRAADKMAQAAGGKDKAITQLGADFIKYSTRIGRSAQDSIKKFTDAGGIDASTIKDRADCDKRLAAVGDFDQMAREHLTMARGIDVEIDRLGKVHGVGPRDMEQFKRGVHNSGRIEKVVRIRELDVELAAAFKDYLTLLRDNWGKWKVEEGQVMFTATGVVPRFNEIVGKIQDLSEEQNGLIAGLSQPAP